MTRRQRAMASTTGDRHADDLAARLGAALKDARRKQGLTQAVAAQRAGFDQVTWSRLERSRDGRFTLATWDRAAHALGTVLSAHLPEASAAAQPRDSVHLRNQELMLRTALLGGWRGVPEQALDADVIRSRHGDVVLARNRGLPEFCIIEVVDWIDDAGASVRDFDRRLAALERWAIGRTKGGEEIPRTSGCWLLRSTQRNRQLVSDHRNFFRGRFPGSGREWLAALTEAQAAMPAESALLWVDVKGARIFAAHLGGA